MQLRLKKVYARARKGRKGQQLIFVYEAFAGGKYIDIKEYETVHYPSLEEARKAARELTKAAERQRFDVSALHPHLTQRPGIPFRQFCSEYLDYRRSAGLSPKTVHEDEWALGLFGEWLPAGRRIGEISGEDLRNFQNYLKTRVVARTKDYKNPSYFSPASINKVLTHLKAAFNHARKQQKLIAEDIFLGLEPLRVERRKRPLTAEAVARYRAYFRGQPRRMLEVFDFIFTTGCRTAGVIDANLKNYFAEEFLDEETGRRIIKRFLGVTEKFSKYREIPLSPDAAAVIEARIRYRNDPNLEEELRATLRGQDLQRVFRRLEEGYIFFEYSREDSITQFFGRASRALKYPYTPHDLRDTFATIYIQNGGNLKVLSEILGHSSEKVTEDHYLEVTRRAKARGIEKFAPRIPADPQIVRLQQ